MEYIKPNTGEVNMDTHKLLCEYFSTTKYVKPSTGYMSSKKIPGIYMEKKRIVTPFSIIQNCFIYTTGIVVILLTLGSIGTALYSMYKYPVPLGWIHQPLDAPQTLIEISGLLSWWFMILLSIVFIIWILYIFLNNYCITECKKT